MCFFRVDANKTQTGFCPRCHALSCLSLDWLSITRLGCLCRALSFLGIWQDETGLIAEIACLARSVANVGCFSDWLTKVSRLSDWLTKAGCLSNWLTKVGCLSNWLTKVGCLSDWLTKVGCLAFYLTG